jgi:hypothetical protein
VTHGRRSFGLAHLKTARVSINAPGERTSWQGPGQIDQRESARSRQATCRPRAAPSARRTEKGRDRAAE